MSSGGDTWLDDDVEDFWEEEPKGRRRGAAPSPPSSAIPVVQWFPITCPGCGANRRKERVTTGGYREKLRRYHVCKRCGVEFHSEEWKPPAQP